MSGNLYTQIIADGLKISDDEAYKLQNFINIFFDDFRWSNATKLEIIRTAKEAQTFITNQQFAEFLAKAGA